MQLKNLKTKFLGRNLIYHNKIDSTQSEIWRLIKKDEIINGTVVLADIQTDGKGTHGRAWYTDEENNIAFSLYITPNCNIKNLDGITLKIAQLIIGIFKDQYNIDLQIELPNDIVFNGKKIGGILTETQIVSEVVKYLVIGIGINTNKKSFNDEIKDIATSIRKEFNINADTQSFVTEFCNRFEKEIFKRTN